MVSRPVVYIVDDDEAVRDSLRLSLQKLELSIAIFASAEEFLSAYDPNQSGCLVLDIRMPGMDGLELQQLLAASETPLPIIFVTGHGDVPASVRAIKAGAIDFLLKPYRRDALLECIHSALARDAENRAAVAELASLKRRFDRLSPREREVMTLMAAGSSTASNKDMAAELGLSHRTVENYRAWVMEKMQATSLSDLVDMAKRLGHYRP